MQPIEHVRALRALALEWRQEGRKIALVPTQGALHAGKEALLREAMARADRVIISVFVNPLQFGPSEPSAHYPRRLEADLAVCAALGAHAVFAPGLEEIYPRGYSTFVTEEALGRPLEGQSRPAHFRGIATLLAKLLVVTVPDLVFVGQKTAQRAALMRKVVADLGFSTEVVVVPTAREADGLAAGLGNASLTPTQRQEALALSRALQKARSMSDAGVRSTDRIIAEVTHLLGQNRRVRIIYVAIVDPGTMEPAREVVPGHSLLVIAAWIDEVRLVDNVGL